ncbi:phosphoadenosine phosphosulfate reductase family protein [Patescibacteria group bacterium]|nr:phosphoadenosine phosphosulfate reductase family protein [Patescibacteria group bacterium]
MNHKITGQHPPDGRHSATETLPTVESLLPPLESLVRCQEVTQELNSTLEKLLNLETTTFEEEIQKIHAIIRWGYKATNGRMFVSTSGGETSAILPHLIKSALADMPEPPNLHLIFINTQCYPPETLDMVHSYLGAAEEDGGLGFTINEFGPTPEEAQALFRENPDWWNNPDLPTFQRVAFILKGAPTQEALEEMRQRLGPNGEPILWLRAIRATQTPERAAASIIEPGAQAIRLHPLLKWTKQQIQEYIKKYDLPINGDHVDLTKPGKQRECPMDLIDRAE